MDCRYCRRKGSCVHKNVAIWYLHQCEMLTKFKEYKDNNQDACFDKLDGLQRIGLDDENAQRMEETETSATPNWQGFLT